MVVARVRRTAAGPALPVLADGATVAILGGGPAGAFSALHLLDVARQRNFRLRVVIFERRRRSRASQSGAAYGPYEGCPQCAGGLSPRLNDALRNLDIKVPPRVLQSRIQSITVQGNWKHIHLPVPAHREMLSVYRGALPVRQQRQAASFDSLLLDTALERGAELIGSRVFRAFYDASNRPVLCSEVNDKKIELVADFAIFAGGVNERENLKAASATPADLFRMLQPNYKAPKLRRALIFELEAPVDSVEARRGELHFIESSVNRLRLDMCSIMPKRGYFTVTLIGGSVDECSDKKQNLQLIREFLAIPQIRRTLPPETTLRVGCICNPSIVVGSATLPFAHRAAAVGDMATSRQYKDGILSAHDMAYDLSQVIFNRGIDAASLEAGYGKTLARFKKDNRFASLIYYLYRWFFTSPSLSRIIYQTYASERKSKHEHHRDFEKIFWAISSGDQSYEKIAWSMLRPPTLWKILSGGVYVTGRNWLAERFFGLDWTGIGRFPTAVALEQLETKRDYLLQSRKSEMECIYTIRIRNKPAVVRSLLAEFGETDRPYLNPRWVLIRRSSGEPLSPGCVIEYRVFGGLMSFSIHQLPCEDENLLRYEVTDGFANGGSFLFEIVPESQERCSLTVYLAFDYERGRTLVERIFWRTFRLLFPEFIHDVLWNHALCQFKQQVEAVDLDQEPEIIDREAS